MADFPLVAEPLGGNPFITGGNLFCEIVKIDGDSNGNTFSYTLKGPLAFDFSIVGIPPDLTPSVADGVLTLTPVGDIGDFVNLALLIFYKKP